jgi:hypothetical protein
MIKAKTQGKRIGSVAFVFTEILIITVFGILTYSFFVIPDSFDFENVNYLIGSQIFVLTVTWGAKASSNFAKKIKFKNEDEEDENDQYIGK